MTPSERLWNRVDKETSPGGCWLWTGGTNGRYGRLTFKTAGVGRTVYAHRLAWELLRGPIPDGYVIDHLCRVLTCVNPDHLEPVSYGTNQLRGYSPSVGAAHNLAKTHCPHGHPYSGPNLRVYDGRRHCRACGLESSRRHRARKKQASTQ